MDIEIDSPAKALHEGHGAALHIPDAAGARPAAERGKHGLYEDMENIPHQARIISQTVAESDGHRKDPLSDRDMRKNPVNKVIRSVRHPPPATGRAYSTPLAGIRHDAIPPAGIAVHAQESSRQNAALQKLAQFALDELRDNAFALTLPGQEGLEVFGDCGIENTVRRIARHIIRGGIAYRKTIILIQRHAGVVSDLQLILRRADSILASHWRCELPRLWEAAIDLIDHWGVEPTFSSAGLKNA